MQSYLADFNYFIGLIFDGISTIWNWLTSNILGEILIFMIIISIFFLVLNLFIDSKD